MRRFLRALTLFAPALLSIVLTIGQGAPLPARVQAQAGSQTTTLAVTDGYDTKLRKRLSEDGKVYTVQSSDDDRWETEADYITAFQFSNALPANAEIQSVKVYVEHHEENDFGNGALRWEAGIGDLRNPIALTSRTPPILRGKGAEARVEWDVTAYFITPVLLNDLKLVVRNNDGKGKKTKTDYVFVVVTYSFGPVATPSLTPTRTLPPPTATATLTAMPSATPTNPPEATPTLTPSPPPAIPLVKVYAPMIARDTPLTTDNHTACTAYMIAPPTTIVQAADNAFNLYRFVAAAASYAVTLNNYATSGQLQLYRIIDDMCATTGTVSVGFVEGFPIASPSFQTTLDMLTLGESYLLVVNTTGTPTNQPYTLAIKP